MSSNGIVPVYDSASITLYQGNCMDVLPTLPAGSVQTCITSPPYWGLRDYGVEGQLGLERVPDCLGWATKQPCGECYVCHTVAWAREVRRVLRDDGCLWLVLGDSYTSGNRDSFGPGTNKGQPKNAPRRPQPVGLKPKDLVGIPWRVALALQADDWWLRSDVIWAKPNPMPESVTDRPTKAHEYVFLLTKSARYYWDAEAVKEENSPTTGKWGKSVPSKTAQAQGNGRHGDNSFLTKEIPHDEIMERYYTNGRNLRSVWNIATQPYAGAHFAVFPEKLVEPMVKAATSERGCCPRCGKAWERVVEKIGTSLPVEERHGRTGHVGQPPQISGMYWTGPTTRATNNWSPACTCDTGDPIPCTILDPFGGSGTVAAVAMRLGRLAILCELNPKYIELQKQRIEQTQPALAGMVAL